jgi:hypothetical protein
MSGYRFDIETSAGPSRRGRVGGGAVLLVRVRIFDGPGVCDSVTGEHAPEPEAYTDLLPSEARSFAVKLLQAAEDAELHTERARWWEHETARCDQGAPR